MHPESVTYLAPIKHHVAQASFNTTEMKNTEQPKKSQILHILFHKMTFVSLNLINRLSIFLNKLKE